MLSNRKSASVISPLMTILSRGNSKGIGLPQTNRTVAGLDDGIDLCGMVEALWKTSCGKDLVEMESCTKESLGKKSPLEKRVLGKRVFCQKKGLVDIYMS